MKISHKDAKRAKSQRMSELVKEPELTTKHCAFCLLGASVPELVEGSREKSNDIFD